MTAAQLRSDFHRGLDEIDHLLIQMIAGVEDAIVAASLAVLSSDHDAVEQVVLRGEIVEDLHCSVESLVLTNLARQAPVGGDLRFLLAALRIVPELVLTRNLADDLARRGSMDVGGNSHHTLGVLWPTCLTRRRRCGVRWPMPSGKGCRRHAVGSRLKATSSARCTWASRSRSHLKLFRHRCSWRWPS